MADHAPALDLETPVRDPALWVFTLERNGHAMLSSVTKRWDALQGRSPANPWVPDSRRDLSRF